MRERARYSYPEILSIYYKSARGTLVGRTLLNSRRSTSTASRSPARRLANAASASCDSANEQNVASVSSQGGGCPGLVNRYNPRRQ